MRFAMSGATDFLGGRFNATNVAGTNLMASASNRATDLEMGTKEEASGILTDARVDAAKTLGESMAGAAEDAAQGQMFSTLGSIGGSILGGFKPGGAFNKGPTVNKGNAYDIGYSLGSMWN